MSKKQSWLFGIRPRLGRFYLKGPLLLLVVGLLLWAVTSQPKILGLRLGPTLAGGSRAQSAPRRSPSSNIHVVNIPYFIEDPQLSSTLTLNNNLSRPAIANVTLFNRKGEPFAVPSITLAPQLAARFGVRELIANAPGDFSSGNIQVSYQGTPMAVTCQVSVVSERQRFSFESVESSPDEFASTRLDGIVWVPDDKTEASLALTNIAPHAITVTATSEQEGKKTKAFTLNPRETQVADLKEFLDKKTDRSEATLLSLQHNGVPGDLITTGFAVNLKTGFASNLQFVDCATAVSSRLAGAHVRFGPANPQEGFPAGTTFLASLVIANAGSSTTEVAISVDYTIHSKARRIELEPIVLAARRVRLIELSQELALRGVTGPVEEGCATNL